MKSRIILAVVLLVALMLPFASQAMAANGGDCGVATYALAPSSGPAGSTATASGTGALGTQNFYWDSSMGGAMVGSAVADQYGNYTATIAIPMDATLGMHNVVLVGNDAQENPIECAQPFTVVAATAEEGVQPDAYPEAGVTRLPSTGFMVLLPAAGLLAGGALMAARRRQ